MILSYFKIAYRNLLKNKGYSFLNIFGLAIGITCASLIFLWVEDQISYNTNFPKQDRVYYVPTNQKFEGEWRTFYSTPGPLAEDMRNEIPGIVRATRSSPEKLLFRLGENSLSSSGRYADADFLEIFSLNFVQGQRETAFKSPEGIVIDEDLAVQLFGTNENVIGRVLKVNDKDIYTVTGVFEKIPNNVTFKFNWVAPFERYAVGEEWMNFYGNNFSDTFVELGPNVDFATVDNQVRDIISTKAEDENTIAFLHSIKDWHLRSKFEYGKIVGGRITYVRLFIVIALVILLIACINFMNLSTARSEKRANEVGVRKAMGSNRQRLIIQFITESLILSFMATALSILMLTLLLPQFNLLIEKELFLGLSEPNHIVTLFGISILCGLLAGLYPAFFLSSFKPVEVLKGLKANTGSASFIRKGLVVGQFTISIVFIIFTILVYQQIQHVKNRELGYDKDQLLSMLINEDFIPKFDVV
ncbi:MAG: ABC transporter permease, partial [Bacteroidota bacterium]